MTQRFDDGLTADQMFLYFQNGAVGTKEFRSFLAKIDENFASVRDPDVDSEIDSEARRRQELNAGDQLAQLVDKEGNLKKQE